MEGETRKEIDTVFMKILMMMNPFFCFFWLHFLSKFSAQRKMIETKTRERVRIGSPLKSFVGCEYLLNLESRHFRSLSAFLF